MSDKFQDTITELQLHAFPKIPEILVVFLYGSVKRGDYSLRHSDLDLFIVLKKRKISEQLKEKIESILFSAGYKFGVKIHSEYQGLDITAEDRSLLRKQIEEGQIIYSTGVFSFDNEQIGLHQFVIYDFSLQRAARKTMFSKVLHGRKSWYWKGKEKVLKQYSGIIDGKNIIELGRGTLMVRKENEKEIQQLFTDYGVIFTLKKIVYAQL